MSSHKQGDNGGRSRYRREKELTPRRSSWFRQYAAALSAWSKDGANIVGETWGTAQHGG